MSDVKRRITQLEQKLEPAETGTIVLVARYDGEPSDDPTLQPYVAQTLAWDGARWRSVDGDDDDDDAVAIEIANIDLVSDI